MVHLSGQVKHKQDGVNIRNIMYIQYIQMSYVLGLYYIEDKIHNEAQADGVSIRNIMYVHTYVRGLDTQ